VLSRTYGETLLETLPPARRAVGPWHEVLSQVRALLRRPGYGG